MEDSIFTKIIKGEVPSHKIYEDDKVYVFLDIHPKTAGHTLVIPKKQVEFVWDLEDEDYRAVMDVAKRVALRIRDVLDYPYIGELVIGMDVPHAHVHVYGFNTIEESRRIPDLNAEPDHPALAELAKASVLGYNTNIMDFLYAAFFGAGVATVAYTRLGRRAGYGNTTNVWTIVGVIFVITTIVFYTIFAWFIKKS